MVPISKGQDQNYVYLTFNKPIVIKDGEYAYIRTPYELDEFRAIVPAYSQYDVYGTYPTFNDLTSLVNPTAATATEKYFYVSEDDVYYQATGGNFIELYEDEVFDESKESTRLKISKFPDISMIFTNIGVTSMTKFPNDTGATCMILEFASGLGFYDETRKGESAADISINSFLTDASTAANYPTGFPDTLYCAWNNDFVYPIKGGNADFTAFINRYGGINFTWNGTALAITGIVPINNDGTDDTSKLLVYTSGNTGLTNQILTEAVSGTYNYIGTRKDLRFVDENGNLREDTQIYPNNGYYTIPLTFGTDENFDLQRDFVQQNEFINVEEEKVIGDIVDMEKVQFEPKSIGTSGILMPVNTIEFNLHFRTRAEKYDSNGNIDYTNGNGHYSLNSNWVSTQGTFWNGFYGVLNSQGHVKGITAIDNKIIEDSYVSDSLGYLGFSDDDVKYQKDRLKKSFLRLLFYDSTDPRNQNLLYYSTIFLDSGELFGKWAKYNSIGDYAYSSIFADHNSPTAAMISVSTDLYNIEKADWTDDKRLSSKITVHDRNYYYASSEGYYLYLYKTDASSIVPSTLYMRAEFNNAKYGVTVPFMLPATGNRPLKVTDEDFPYNGFPKASDIAGATGVDMTKYYSSLYVPFNYLFDKTSNSYVYYPGYTGLYASGTLQFNLFESKLQ